jgi:hypothetical protein
MEEKTLRAASWSGEREQRRPAGAQGVGEGAYWLKEEEGEEGFQLSCLKGAPWKGARLLELCRRHGSRREQSADWGRSQRELATSSSKGNGGLSGGDCWRARGREVSSATPWRRGARLQGKKTRAREKLLVTAEKKIGVGVQNSQGQGRGIRIYRETLGLGFQMGPIGLGWAGPKRQTGCAKYFPE